MRNKSPKFLHRRLTVQGQETDVLTAQGWPWINLQVVPVESGKLAEMLRTLSGRYPVALARGRQDFVIIQIPGTLHPVEINQTNAQDVADAITETLKQAAEFWSENNPL